MKKQRTVFLCLMLASVMVLSACSSADSSSASFSIGKKAVTIAEETTLEDLGAYANYPEEIAGNHITSAIYEKDGIYYTEDEELSAEL
ncbi:MAG: hypothetical protein IJD29_06230, partial [Anaerotignum sp.]|nr:hypothetical protein [Anaerotignum sp.]